MHGLGKQTLNMATRVLKAMKGALNALPNVLEQGIEFSRILKGLVGAFGGPDTVARVEQDFGLPIATDKALIAENIAIADLLGQYLSSLALSQVSRDQVSSTGRPSSVVSMTSL